MSFCDGCKPRKLSQCHKGLYKGFDCIQTWLWSTSITAVGRAYKTSLFFSFLRYKIYLVVGEKMLLKKTIKTMFYLLLKWCLRNLRRLSRVGQWRKNRTFKAGRCRSWKSTRLKKEKKKVSRYPCQSCWKSRENPASRIRLIKIFGRNQRGVL